MSLAEKLFGDAEEILIENGTAYYPTLIDPKIEQEIHPNGVVKEKDGKFYIMGANMESILRAYEGIDPEEYGNWRDSLMKAALPDVDLTNLLSSKIGQTLKTIVFGVMPHFVKRKGIERKKNPEEEMISMIREHVEVSAEYYEAAREVCNLGYVKDRIKNLGKEAGNISDGIWKTRDMEPVMKKALENHILLEEKENLEKIVEEKEALAKENMGTLAALLCLKNKEQFELEDFGFIKKGSDYYSAYVKVGEYALRDFDNQIYLFPSCSVGVDIADGDLQTSPFVREAYKHPFLSHNTAHQAICIRHRFRKGASPAEYITNALDAGVNTLLYGYFNKEGFNGYRFLSKAKVDGDDGHVIFSYEDCKIKEDDERIKSGKVKITNDAFLGGVKR